MKSPTPTTSKVAATHANRRHHPDWNRPSGKSRKKNVPHGFSRSPAGCGRILACGYECAPAPKRRGWWPRRPMSNRSSRRARGGDGGVNKSELVEEVAARTRVATSDVARVIDSFMETVTRSVVRGEKGVLSGFGTFHRQARA